MAREIGEYLDPIINPGGVTFLMKRGTIDFLELAYQEGIAQNIITQIGASYSTSTVYILYGCALSTGGGNTTISSGAIFFNGEIFLCVGQTFTTPSTVVANLSAVSWQPTDAVGNQYADPQQFTGSGNANIHYNRTVVFAGGASGSGTISGTSASDYTNLIGYGSWIDASGGIYLETVNGITPTINYSKYRIINKNTLMWNLSASMTGTSSASAGYLNLLFAGTSSYGLGLILLNTQIKLIAQFQNVFVLCNIASDNKSINIPWTSGSTGTIIFTLICDIK